MYAAHVMFMIPSRLKASTWPGSKHAQHPWKAKATPFFLNNNNRKPPNKPTCALLAVAAAAAAALPPLLSFFRRFSLCELLLELEVRFRLLLLLLLPLVASALCTVVACGPLVSLERAAGDSLLSSPSRYSCLMRFSCLMLSALPYFSSLRG